MLLFGRLNLSKQTIQSFVSCISTDLKYQQITRSYKIGFVAFYVSEKILIGSFLCVKNKLILHKSQKHNTLWHCNVTYKSYHIASFAFRIATGLLLFETRNISSASASVVSSSTPPTPLPNVSLSN